MDKLKFSDIEKFKFQCDLHTYDQKVADRILDIAKDVDIVRVHASKMNNATGQLYPAEQTFYASSDPKIFNILDNIISDHKIASAWVTSDSKIDWNEYYNIRVDLSSVETKSVDFHQIDE